MLLTDSIKTQTNCANWNETHKQFDFWVDKIKEWYFDFIREIARWFAKIIDLEFQRRTFETQLIELAK